MEPRRRLVLIFLLLTMITDDRRRWWRRRPRRRWPIKQVPQVVLELQVGPRSPRNALDRQIGAPVASGHGGPRGTSGRFVLHVELAEGVHQGAVLVLPALLQQRLGRNVVQIVWSVPGPGRGLKGI